MSAKTDKRNGMRPLLAKPLADQMKAEFRKRVARFRKSSGRAPKLSVVLVGDDPASVIYTTKKGQAAVEAGMEHETIKFPASATAESVKDTLKRLNADSHVDGILLQRPVPKSFGTEELIYWVDPRKDVDGFHPENLGRLMLGLKSPVSCTPAGIMALLNYYSIEVKGKIACVVGRSAIVGKPMAALLLGADATVIQCHSHTPEMEKITSQAEILIVAAGKPRLIGSRHVRPGAIVVDVGIHRLPEGGLCGDVSPDVASKAEALTPVPGGVGPMTIAMLLSNTLDAAEASLM